jgi:hypothetical protein
MDTTTAAQQAKVTTATIRTWCRIGAVAATKQAGRWIIDAASLARRIALTPRKTTKKIAYSVETMTAIGGSRWTKAGHDRVYFNDWADFAGLDITRYNTGNISAAAWQGQGVSNAQGAKLAASIDKIWFDAATGKIHCRYGYTESRVATHREVFDATVAGIRRAIAAL